MDIVLAIIGSGALSALISGLFTYLATRSQKKSALNNAVNAILWDTLDGKCKAYIEQGYIPDDDLNRILTMHKCYKDLGGNGYLDALMSKVKALPMSQANKEKRK